MADIATQSESLPEVPTLDDLLLLIDQEAPGMNKEPIERAFAFAAKAHGDTRRRSGELYITHPIEVAKILTNMQLDHETITAALLHDVVEDTDVTIEDIENEFGPRIAHLVEGVTKLGRIPWSSTARS